MQAHTHAHTNTHINTHTHTHTHTRTQEEGLLLQHAMAAVGEAHSLVAMPWSGPWAEDRRSRASGAGGGAGKRGAGGPGQ